VFLIEFPPVSHVIEWPEFLLEDSAFAVNKVVLLMWLSAILSFAVVFLAGRKKALVPSGMQNVGESLVDFIDNGIILQTIGPDGLKPFYQTLLGTFFVFIFTCNLWEIVPVAQMPVNARIALPIFMTGLVWLVYMGLGIIKQGPLKYFKNMCFPPGVPKALYILVTPIEFVSTVLVRPLSLSVRLFANMLAGHLLLVSFATICAALWAASVTAVILPFAFVLLVGLTGFEILVAFLQAFIFTILAAVYIGSSLHPEH
jgi:F-type H+-transporting ATPase subunit a